MATSARICGSLLVTCLITEASEASALNILPWTPRDKEIQWTTGLEAERFTTVAGSPENFASHQSYARLYSALEVSPIEAWTFGIEAAAVKPHTHRILVDYGKVQFSYRSLDDVVGDPFSLAVGANYQATTPQALHTFSLFHKAASTGSLFMTIGKECAPFDVWQARSWSTLGFGLASSGSPWAFASIEGQKRAGCWIFCGGLFYELGFGQQSLTEAMTAHFEGASRLRFRTLDAKLGSSYGFANGMQLSLFLLGRLAASNAPQDPLALRLELLYPFGL